MNTAEIICKVENHWHGGELICITSPSGKTIYLLKSHFKLLEKNAPEWLSDDQYDTLSVLMSVNDTEDISLRKDEMIGIVQMIEQFSKANSTFGTATTVPAPVPAVNTKNVIHTVNVHTKTCSCGCNKVRVKEHTNWYGYHCPNCKAGGSVSKNPKPKAYPKRRY